MAEPLVVQFPPETVDFINELSKDLNLDHMEVISRGLGLLRLWLDAQNHKPPHTIVERPAGGETRSDEYVIDIAH